MPDNTATPEPTQDTAHAAPATDTTQEATHASAKRFDAVPAAACQFAGGALALGDNGDAAKTAPVRLLARSSLAIEHWFWGKVIHDLSGMRLHKSKLSIDYAHEPGEVLGYLNHFEATSEGLVTSGALVPYRDGDRASEVLYKMRAGVPYEASINFGGAGIKIQEVQAGEHAMVNGAQFDGPGIVIREWPLRNVAICPLGADMHTESAASFSDPKQTVKVQEWKQPMETEKTPAPVTPEPPATVEATQLEAAPAAAVESAAPVAEVKPEQAPPPVIAVFAVEEFGRMISEFGLEIAADTVLQGGTYADAKARWTAHLAEENETLKAAVKDVAKGAAPATFVDAEPAEKKHAGKPGLDARIGTAAAAWAAGAKFVDQK